MPAAAGAGAFSYGAPPVAAGGRTLVINSMQVVIAVVESNWTEELLHCVKGTDDACEMFKSGAVLVAPPVNGGLVSPFTAPIPEGSYAEREFEFERPGANDSASVAIRTTNPMARRTTVTRD